MSELLFVFVKNLIFAFLRIFYRVKLIDMENIPKSEGVLLYANHVSMVDMFFISCKMKRRVHYMGKASLFENKISAAIFRFLGAFPVKRGAGDVQAVKTVLRYIKQEKIVGIFPEGTRVRQGARIKAKPGAAMFAVKTGAYILPVRVQASYKIFSEVKIIFGKPYKIQLDKDTKLSKEEMEVISEGILDKIYSLGT